MTADGRSLDDKRTELLPLAKLGVRVSEPLSADEHAKNNLPDVAIRWMHRNDSELSNPRTAQSFTVPKADIEAQGYDLSINRYKQVIHEIVEHRHPKDILADLALLETEIQQAITDLQAML
jgi:type I restriction enzyme M protein